MYLLSSQALLDLSFATRPALKALITRINNDLLHVSVVSVGQVRAFVQSVSQSQARATLEQNVLRTVAAFEMRHKVVPIDLDIAVVWADLLHRPLTAMDRHGTHVELDDGNRLVVATAVTKRLTLIDVSQPYHGSVFGLAIDTY